MSDKMYDLRDMLSSELDKITDKGTVTRESLEIIDKLTHSIKSIDTILAMEEAGDYGYKRNRYARRDSRYSRDDRRRHSDREDDETSVFDKYRD